MVTRIKTPAVVGREGTQVLILSDTITFNTPIYEIIDERFSASVTEYSISADMVIINGTAKATVIYKEPKNSFNEGLIRYHEEVFNFGGFVKVTGARPGDSCDIEKIEVTEYQSLIPKTRDGYGNILTARQKFIINIDLTVTRNQSIDIPQEFSDPGSD